MKKIKYFAIIAALIGIFALGGCSNQATDANEPTPQEGELIEVPINFSTLALAPGDDLARAEQATRTTDPEQNSSTIDPEPATRAIDGTVVDGTNAVIKNLWVIQFDGATSASKVKGVPRFVSTADINTTTKTAVVQLFATTAPCYQVWVANLPQGATYDWGLSATSTFADVASRLMTVATEADAYSTIGGVKTLVMNSRTTFRVGTDPLTPVFSRNMAKVTLRVNTMLAGTTITSARLGGIPQQVYVADEALKTLGSVGTGQLWPYGSAMFDYTATEANTLAAVTALNTSRSGTISWYIPRNNQGTSAATTLQEKTLYAPINATYIELKVRDAAGKSGTYRLYPGANTINDYNINPNTEYITQIDIRGVGDSEDTDSRVTETYEDRDMRGTQSNCYILNPNPSGVRKYKIPVTQVNRYWSEAAEGYGTRANALGTAESWTVALLWSDIDNNGGSYITRATGSGPNDYFELSIPAGLKTGNFTVKLYKTADATKAILWSWHFWVTDYNPDGFANSLIDNSRVNGDGIPNGVFTYPVTGGQVERYVGAVWGAGGVYERKVIMDRSIGAVETNFTTQSASGFRGQLTYQFGRKDPFPLSTQYGTTTTYNNSDLQVPISSAVGNPTKFQNRTSRGAWSSEVTGIRYSWNDPEGTRLGAKSIYDPCPAGWRVPAKETWEDFKGNRTAQNANRDLSWDYGRGIGTSASNIKGIRYWPGTATSPVLGKIWYPSQGIIVGANPAFIYYSTPYVFCLSSSPESGLGAIDPTNVYPQYGQLSTRSDGLSVRCVQE